jgi:hypothetical protein
MTTTPHRKGHEVSSATTFTEEEALRAETLAEEAVGARWEEVRARIEAEAEEATELARQYADRLAAGGDPLDYPKPSEESRRTGRAVLVSAYLGMEVVYRQWNFARGGRHDVEPFQNGGRFRIAERLVEASPDPVTYADLCDLWRGGTKPSSDQVIKVALDIEERGELVARRTKVAGKVAFFVRPRRPDDPPQGSYPAWALLEEKV